MSILDKLATMVGANQQQQQQNQQQQQPTNVGNSQSNQFDTVVPGAPNSMQTTVLDQQQGVPAESKSPLESFKDLFNNNPKKPENGEPNGAAASAVDSRFMPVNKEDLAKVVSGIDFIQPTAEVQGMLQKIQAGDVSVLPQLINHANRQQYLQQTLLMTDLLEKLGSTVTERIQETLPNKFREYSARTAATDSNPIYKNPAAAPVVGAIRQQILQKFPDATPSEVVNLTEKYLAGFADLVKGNNQSGTNSQNARNTSDMDWGKWFTSEH